MNRYKRALAGLGIALVGALGLAVPSQVASAAPVQVVQATSSTSSGIEVGLSSLKPPSKPPTVTSANSVKVTSSIKATRHALPNAGGVTAQSTTACSSPPCYFYVGGLQNSTNTGLYANVTVNWMYADYYARDSGAHSLVELAAITKRANNNRDIVEIGITSDRLVNGSGNDEPHMFVFYWVNGVGMGYNTGYVNYTGTNNCTYHPGADMSAATGTATALGVEYVSTGSIGWWFSQGGKWCGYFPADPAGTSTATNKWYGSGANFTSASQGQAFGEVASSFNEPCTDMGNDKPGDGTVSSPYNYNTMPGYVSSVSFATGSPTVSLTAFRQPTTSAYTQNMLASNKTFYFGGAGWDSNGLNPGAWSGQGVC